MPLATVNIDKLYEERVSAFIKDADHETLKKALIARKPLLKVSEALLSVLRSEYEQDRVELIKNLTQNAIASQLQEDEHASQSHDALVTQFNNELAQLEARLLELESDKPEAQEQIATLSEQIKKDETNLINEQNKLEGLQVIAQLRYPMTLDEDQKETLVITNPKKLAQINQVNEQGQKCTSLQQNLEEKNKQRLLLQKSVADVSDMKTKLEKLEQEALEREKRIQERKNVSANVDELLSRKNNERLTKAMEQGIAELDQINDKLQADLARYNDTSYESFTKELELLLALRQKNQNAGMGLNVNDDQAAWLFKRIQEIKQYPEKMKALQQQLNSLDKDKKALDERIDEITKERNHLRILNSTTDPELLRDRRNKALSGSIFWASGSITSFLIIFAFMPSPLNFIVPGVFALATTIYLTIALIDHIRQVIRTKEITKNNTQIDDIENERDGITEKLDNLKSENARLNAEIQELTSSLSCDDDFKPEPQNTVSNRDTQRTSNVRYRLHPPSAHPSSASENSEVKTQDLNEQSETRKSI